MRTRMFRGPTTLALFGALIAPSILLGQAQPTTYFGGGVTLPMGQVSESHGFGYNLGTQFSWPLTSWLAVLGSLEYRDVRRDDDATVQRLQDEGNARWGSATEFDLGGGFLDGGNRTSIGGLAHAQLMLRPGGGRMIFYLLAGGGLSRTALTSLHVYFIGEDDDYDGRSEIAGALDFGGGLNFRLTERVGIFAQATHLTLMTEGESTSMAPIQLGLTFIMSDRFVR